MLLFTIASGCSFNFDTYVVQHDRDSDYHIEIDRQRESLIDWHPRHLRGIVDGLGEPTCSMLMMSDKPLNFIIVPTCSCHRNLLGLHVVLHLQVILLHVRFSAELMFKVCQRVSLISDLHHQCPEHVSSSCRGPVTHNTEYEDYNYPETYYNAL